MDRMNCVAEVATPSSRRSTLLCTARGAVGTISSEPSPVTVGKRGDVGRRRTRVELREQADAEGRRDRTEKAERLDPADAGEGLAAQDLDGAVIAKMIGVRTVPEFVADCPRTPCTKSGVYRMTPNIPIPTKNMSSASEAKVRLPNRESGMTGSSALDSSGTNSASAAPQSRMSAMRGFTFSGRDPRSPQPPLSTGRPASIQSCLPPS
jgi:hypothetical protein